MRVGRLGLAVVAAGGLVWAMWTASHPRPLYELTPPTARADLGSAHEPSDCGTIAGRVVWDGTPPTPPPLDRPFSPLLPSRTKVLANPNAPRVRNGRVADAVVWLRGVEPSRSRPWDHPPASVEATDVEFVTRQGTEKVRTGFVRRGEAVQLTTREPNRHSVRGRGAGFFTDILFQPNQPTSRPLNEDGVVELSSATGFYWCRAYLAVSVHPYLARTNEDGEFQLPAVPAGAYELVCWMPNWNVQRLERDPELVVHVRVVFGPDVEKKQSIRVAAGATTEAEFRLSGSDFR